MAVAGGEVIEKLDDMIVRQAEATGAQVDHPLLAEDHLADRGLGGGWSSRRS